MSEKFKKLINEGWKNHDRKSQEVADSLFEGFHLLETPEQFPPFVSLAIHTIGGHLGQWSKAEELLQELTRLDSFQNDSCVYRGLSALSYIQNNLDNFQKYLALCPKEEKDSEVRIYAMAANELVGQKEIKRAKEVFHLTLTKMSSNLEKGDSSARAMAICGNNLACELEEKEVRSEEENEFMVLAAQTARKYWEVAGSWVEVERAEYRLAMSLMKANRFNEALEHARNCERICLENEAAPFEKFFAYEALTKVNQALCAHTKTQVKDEYQAYCTVPFMD